MHLLKQTKRRRSFRCRPFVAGLLVPLLPQFLTACASNAVTGRPQLMLVSEATVTSVSMGAYADLVEDARLRRALNNDPQTTERVRRIAARIIPQASKYRPALADWNWEVNVFRADTPNAFCLAGGKIVVNSSLLAYLQPSDDELAQILSHEIAHTLSGHGQEKISNAIASRTALKALAISQRIDTIYTKPFRGLVEETVTAPNSRQTELEADRVGILLAANAGFDPYAAVTLWEKVRARQGDQEVSFNSTHPPASERIAALQVEVQRVQTIYREAQKTLAAPQAATPQAPAP